MAEEGSSKKRRNDRDLNQDNWNEDDGDAEEQATGEFQLADEETLAKRPIIKAKRRLQAGGQDGAPAAANPFAGIKFSATSSSSNPFASVSLTSSAQASITKESSEQKPGDVTQPETKEDEEPKADAKPSFLSGDGGKSPFAGLASTGVKFGASGTAPSVSPQDASNGDGTMASGTGSIFALAASPPAFAGLVGGGFGAGHTGGEKAFGTKDAGQFPTVQDILERPNSSGVGDPGSSGAVASAFPSRNEVKLATGEEEDETLFSSEGVLFEMEDVGDSKRWTERGRGQLRLNRTASGATRMVMRQRGNLRLLLNAPIFPSMALSEMEGGKGATFTCVNFARSSGEEEAAAAGKGAGAAAGGGEGAKDAEAAAAGAAEATGGEAGEETEGGAEEGAGGEQKLTLYAVRIRSPESLSRFMGLVAHCKGSANRDAAADASPAAATADADADAGPGSGSEAAVQAPTASDAT